MIFDTKPKHNSFLGLPRFSFSSIYIFFLLTPLAFSAEQCQQLDKVILKAIHIIKNPTTLNKRLKYRKPGTFSQQKWKRLTLTGHH